MPGLSAPATRWFREEIRRTGIRIGSAVLICSYECQCPIRREGHGITEVIICSATGEGCIRSGCRGFPAPPTRWFREEIRRTGIRTGSIIPRCSYECPCPIRREGHGITEVIICSATGEGCICSGCRGCPVTHLMVSRRDTPTGIRTGT